MLKTTIARRGFLRLMGAAAATPAAVEMQRATAAAGVDLSNLSDEPCSIHDSPSLSKDDMLRDGLFRELAKMGLPQWKKDALWEDAKVVRSLDPDLAANRSFSVAGKVHVQQQRNYEKAKASALASLKFDEARHGWLKRHGINWF